MANGNGRQPSVKIDLPLDPQMLAQNLGLPAGAFGGGQQQQQGQNSVLAPQQQAQVSTPQVVDQIRQAPEPVQQQIVDAQPVAPPPPAPSANLPDIVPQQTAQPTEVELLQSSLNDPERQALLAQFDELFQQGQQSRRSNIDNLREILRGEQERGPDKIKGVQKALANFSDAFFDTELSKNVTGPESQEDRANRLAQLQRAVSQEEGALNASEIQALRERLGNSGQQRLIQAIGRTQAREERRADKKEVNFKTRREKLGKEAVKLGLPGLNTTLNNINTEIPGGIRGFDATKTNLPGIGGADAALPLGRLSAKGRRLRQLAMGLGNQVLKLRSGAQINEQEATRILGELGIDQAIGEGGGVRLVFKGTRTDQDFVNGVRDAQDALLATEETLKLSFGEDVFDVVSPGFRAGRAAPGATTRSDKLKRLEELRRKRAGG